MFKSNEQTIFRSESYQLINQVEIKIEINPEYPISLNINLLPPWRRDKEHYSQDEITELVKENNQSLINDVVSKLTLQDLAKDILVFEEHFNTLEPICCKDKNNTEYFDQIRQAH